MSWACLVDYFKTCLHQFKTKYDGTHVCLCIYIYLLELIFDKFLGYSGSLGWFLERGKIIFKWNVNKVLRLVVNE